MALTPPYAAHERRAKALLGLGALMSVAGVGVSGTVSQSAGGVLLIAGWLVFIVAVHRFGRTGAD
jgi:hypothetical protein